jgi:glycogen debranching enzyme
VPDDLIILDGCTFFFSDGSGDVEAVGPQGLFYRDVRHLSRWLLRLDGRPVEPLSSRRVDYYSARVVGAATDDGDAPPVSVRRDRFVTEGVYEEIHLENLTTERQAVRLELSFAADFADVMEAQEGASFNGRHWVDARARSAVLWHDREGYRRGTAITFTRAGRVGRDRAVFDLELRPRASWTLGVDVTPIVDGERQPPLVRGGAFHVHPGKMPTSIDRWLERAPDIVTDDATLARTYRQSLLDLAALRIRPDGIEIFDAMPGGGLPWFMAVFGRDSLITAYQTLPFQPDLARATLQALARMQATEWDNFRDAEPGKMPHELRRGTLAALGKIPHTPYYGTHDATLLWLIVLDEYVRWSGDVAFAKAAERTARAALAWLEGPADLDGDGYLEYRKRSTSDRALDNQCWKDSKGSIRFADGRLAEGAIATCELQGYAYDARLRMARLLREVYRDEEEAARLEEDAAALKTRFNRDFWVSARRHYALALDGEKEQVDSMTSNTGHLLWSGIVSDARLRSVVRRLLREDMFTGWGIRTMSSLDAAYHPLEYHLGTVWPHDTALIAEGMRRAGFADEAARVCDALLDATRAFTNQLPEVFAGFPRDETEMPVEYPDALKPQSWAAGAPLLALRTMLGLDAEDGRLRSRPRLPRSLDRVALRGVEVEGTRFDVDSARRRATPQRS